MELRTLLLAEFTRRQERNRRYSLRGFAHALGIDHSTLSRLLHGKRSPSRRLIQQLADRLHWSAEVRRTLLDAADAHRVLDVVADDGFRPDCRWISARSGIALDDVQRTLQDLIRRGMLMMPNSQQWKVVSP